MQQRWRLVLLGFELALFALILVLPQVDLPDFTFSGGSAPVAVPSRLCSSPLQVVAAVATLIPPLPQMTEALGEILAIPSPPPLHSRQGFKLQLPCKNGGL